MPEEERDSTISAGIAMGVLAAVLIVGLVVLVLLGAGPLDSPEGGELGEAGVVGSVVTSHARLAEVRSWVSRTVGRVRTRGRGSGRAGGWTTIRRR